jgi:uncharacterized protein with von Willebrand factor type A (vWA) domain
MDTLSRNVSAFCALLREKHGFAIGHAEVHEALRALERVGLTERARVRSALRLICCGSPSEIAIFDRAFEAFFTAERTGVPQPAYRPRHTRPGHDDLPQSGDERAGAPAKPEAQDDADGPGGTALERRPETDESDDASALPLLRARYSPAAGGGEPPALARDDADAMLVAAGRMIASVRLGRSRRWRASERGGRFDLRRTIRASLQSGGDPVELRFRGHPLRNPRFVVLIDGSRSISEQTGAVRSFARALCSRTLRANVLYFSTELRDVTRDVRAGTEPVQLGAAWGGGTKIGASLDAFVTDYGPRMLTPDTFVIIASDGLDVGDVQLLERAMREIDRRSAAILWLNPHAAAPGYAATARGMRAALPYVTILAAADDAPGFERLAARLARDPRIRGRRR